MTESRDPRIHGLHRLPAYAAVAGAWSESVGLACSGGVDSTALLLLASWAMRKGRVGPFLVMHVDHRTRPETKCEQRWVCQLAQRLGVPFTGIQIDRATRTRSGSPEEILRAGRYDALWRAAEATGVRAVVTAHTLDDQIETVLMRLISGTSTVGASGMDRETELSVSGGKLKVIRPLLGTRRAELERVLDAANIVPLLDPTNTDPAFRRNAIRHRVVPALRDIDPGFGEALARTVALAGRDAALCDALADEAYRTEVTIDREAIFVRRDFVRSGAAAITSRVLRRIALGLAGDRGREVTFERIEAVRLAAAGRTGAVIELPGGVAAEVTPDALRFVVGRRLD